jgi:endonuclease/exonuclease/phosphatase family metal-dependent hydrolase
VASEEWFPLDSGLSGVTIGRTRVNDAAVFQRRIPRAGAERAVTDQLVTQTLNLASGLGASQQIRNNAITRHGDAVGPLWLCMADRVADVVVCDLRRRVVPMRGTADPVVVLMLQEARPLLVDAVAQGMATEFARDISTLFVAQTPDSALANAEPANCDDDRPPERYRCEYGNALVATAPLEPVAGLNFTHAPENRMFVAATIRVGTRPLTVGTYHAQIVASGREGHQSEERRALEMLTAVITGPVIVGGDFNNRSFTVDGLRKYGSFRAPVDAFVVRDAQHESLGTCRTRSLRVRPYELDHRRVACKWRLERGEGTGRPAWR